MSQFRIKNIDNSIPDEWVYKINEGLGSLGDDIDARDPNELAEAILDTQTILLKVSSLAPGAILKPNSGLAERITILEGIAGNSALQDIYNNGSTIAVVAGKPLVFGIREEFKLDDAGNLSFKPATMKVRGSSFQTLDLTNLSVTTNLGDLLVGATSPGAKLTLRAEDYLYLKDVFLTNEITLSEPGNSALVTNSQSIVGAINELKASTFNTSFQSVYDQSNPPKLTTNIGKGAVIIEDLNSASTADALRVTGILNVTRRAKLGDVRIGSNTSIADTTGYVTSDPIKTTNRVETPTLTSGVSDLTITDRRVSFPFSDSSVSGLSTANKSIIGAINELKTDLTSVGNSALLLNVEHDSVTGFHKIITTQAEIGNNSTKRFVVKNSSGSETFSINGSGDLIAGTATIGGLPVLSLLNQLSTHLSDDGTSHTAFASHLLNPNPHNTVKSIMNLSGSLLLSSPDSSINISNSGNTINFTFNNNITLQQVYDNLLTKELKLGFSGIAFKNNLDELVLNLNTTEVDLYKNLSFNNQNPEILSNEGITVKPLNNLILTSTSGDVEIKTVSPLKSVKIQNINFSEPGAEEISPILGNSVTAAFKKIADVLTLEADNASGSFISTTAPYFIDSMGNAWPHIANFHPANEFLDVSFVGQNAPVSFFWQNKSSLYYATSEILDSSTGVFYASGTHNITATSETSLPLSFHKGAKLYPYVLGYYDLIISNASSITAGNTITIDLVTLTAVSGIPANMFQYQIGTSATSQIKNDQTRDNLIRTINATGFPENATSIKAGIWGETAKGYVDVSTSGVSNATAFQINTNNSGENVTVTLTAATTPTGFLNFQASANGRIVAKSLADAINRTTFKDGTNGTGTTGHKCRATASGTIVTIEYYKPGQIGNLITFGAGTGFTLYNASGTASTSMSGGTSVLRIYNMDLSSIPYAVEFSPNANGFTSSGSFFQNRESINDYFITGSTAFNSLRNYPHYVPTELGTIEAVSGNVIRFKIKG